MPGRPLPKGRALRVQPALMYNLDRRQEKTSWRSYGGLGTEADVTAEIGYALKKLGKPEWQCYSTTA